MKHPRNPAQTVLLWLAFVAGALIRFGGLGTAPLTDGEAELALQALQIAQGKTAAVHGYPLEVILSAAFFFLFGSSNFLARFLAAVSGTLLILGVISQRERLGASLTLALTFALAFDPALVAQSRQMGSVLPALVALGALVLFASQARWRSAGLALGLGILSGPTFWHGSLVLLLAGLAFNTLEKRLSSPSGIPLPVWRQDLPAQAALRTVGVTALLTILFGSTLFLFYPRGLGASLSPLLGYLGGWTSPASVSVSVLLLGLSVYHTPAILFGAVSIARSLIDRRSSEFLIDHRPQAFLGVWFGIAILMALLYPARQMSHLIWAILPLWVLAGQEIARWIETLEQPLWATLTLAGITLIFLCLFWLQLAAAASFWTISAGDWLRVVTVFSSLALIALFVWLAELVWSTRLAWQGMILGFLVAFFLYTVSNVWGVAFSHPWSQVFRQELWKPYPQIGDAALLLKTVQDLSRWKSGRADSLPIVIAVNSPAMRWLFRQQHHVVVLPEDQALAQLSVRQAGQLPAVLITSAIVENPALAATYRGQDFIWHSQPNWEGITHSPLNWLLFRKGTWEVRPVILWARTDLFPDGQSLSGGGELPLEIPFEEELPLDQP